MGLGPRATTVTRRSAAAKSPSAYRVANTRCNLPSPHAGEEDRHIELAGEQPFGKPERLRIFRQRNLAHGRGDERLATLFPDQ